MRKFVKIRKEVMRAKVRRCMRFDVTEVNRSHHQLLAPNLEISGLGKCSLCLPRQNAFEILQSSTRRFGLLCHHYFYK